MERKIVIVRSALVALAVLVALALGSWGLERSRARPPSSDVSAAAARFAYLNASENDIFVSSPAPGVAAESSITVQGFARGPWYFEATFPVVVVGARGVIVGEGRARAESDWMTSAFVPFFAKIDFKDLYNGPATVILKNDNPSGDRAREKSLSFPILIQ